MSGPTISGTGLEIEAFDEVLEAYALSLQVGLDLTDAQRERLRTNTRSTLGQLIRVAAEAEVRMQEALLDVYNTLAITAEGAALDRVARLLGVTREPAISSSITGPATGTAATSIPNGTRLQYDGAGEAAGSVWLVTGGPYTIGGGGSVTITIESEEGEAYEPALDPDAGFDEWTILDTVIGFSDVGTFESAAQPVVGSPIETDAALRARMAIEAFRRGQGPTLAIEAAISAVAGVTYVRAYDNPTDAADANGLPARSVNVIVEGGADAAVAAAYFASRSAGATLYALAGGTAVSETVTDAYGFAHTVAFNRVAEVPMYIRCTLTTSTAEDEPPAGLVDAVAALLLEQAPELFGIGDDVRPYKLIGAIHAEDYSGIDNVLVELSLDGIAWATTVRTITIRQRATFAAARITVLEA